MAVPTILDIARDPAHSTFAEAFVRHGSESAGLVPAASLSYLREYARTLAGLSSSATLYLTPTGEPAIPLIVGSLFAFGFAPRLIAPRHGFARAVALTVIITIAGAAATANNAYVGRMSPLLPMLLVLAALSLDSVQRMALRLSKRIAGGDRIAAPATEAVPAAAAPARPEIFRARPDGDGLGPGRRLGLHPLRVRRPSACWQNATCACSHARS